MWGRLRKKNYVLVKCDPITLDVGGDLRLDDPVHVTLDVECAIQHDKSNPAVAVHSTPKHHTPSVPLVLFSNADVGITLTSAMPPPDLSIPMRETKPGLIGKKKCSQLLACQLSITQWSLAARRCLFRWGPWCGRRTRSVNRLRRLRMVCVDIWALWRPRASATVLVDGLHRSHSYANPVMVWFLEVAHYVVGSRCSQSLLGDVSIIELLCVAHWHIWRHLQSSSWHAGYPMSSLCQR